MTTDATNCAMSTKDADGIAETATLLITRRDAEQAAYAAMPQTTSELALAAFSGAVSSFSLEPPQAEMRGT